MGGSDRRPKRPAGPERGVVFPKDEKNTRSTTHTGKSIFVAALRSVGEHQAADAVKNERNWRYRYNKHFMKMVEISAKSPENALKIARAGLDYSHKNFEYVSEEGKSMSLGEAMSSMKGSFETGIIKGELQRPNEFQLEVPYKKKILRSSELRKQINDWSARGVMEPDCAKALLAMTQNSKWLDLSRQYFVLIGAGSAMGPFIKLLELGANVIAIDIPNRDRLWKRLIETARQSPGTLYFPLSQSQDSIHSDDDLYKAAGCNLLQQPAEILNWLLELSDGPAHDGQLTVGNYTYLDAALHVLLSVSADAIIKGLCEHRKDTRIAFLCTPTDIHAIPSDANREASRQNGFHLGKPIEMAINLCSGGSQLVKNALKPMSDNIHRVDGLSIAQGPNYALAKRLQHWRSMVAYDAGHIVSANIAPSTATLSVVHNKQFAWAYSGMPYFKPFEIFEQDTTNALMAALLIHDVQNPEGPKNPENRERFGIDNTLQLFAHQGLHGGLWRAAYKVNSIGITSVLVHFMGGPQLFLPVTFGLMALPALCYQFLL